MKGTDIMRARNYRQLGLAVAGLLFLAGPAWAVPSFARQTGLPCNACHTTPPELTALGRQFKLDGYTLSTAKQITAPAKGNTSGLQLAASLPISVMFQIADSFMNTVPAGTQNGDIEFPQQLSLFLAGAWSSNVGSFLQVTYSGAGDHFSIDNTDIRYARQSMWGNTPVAWGLDFNNNPTVEDLWNDTPAWGFPWISSDVAPAPAAGALIDGGLAQDVGGVGAYSMFNNHFYVDGTLYRSMHVGAIPPTSANAINIDGAAPYGRVAWQQQVGKNTLFEIGGYGMYVRDFPLAVSGAYDSTRDLAVDFSLDQTIGANQWSLYATDIFEHSTLTASMAAGLAGLIPHHLNTGRIDTTYHWGDRYSATVGVFSTSGTSDPVLYAPTAVSGSASGSPQSSGYVLQAGYWPWQNINFTLQYTGYWRFNGGSTNYDGSGRNATGNNSVYLAGWFIF